MQRDKEYMFASDIQSIELNNFIDINKLSNLLI